MVNYSEPDYLDLAKLYGKVKQKHDSVAYAHSYVYSPQGGTFHLNTSCMRSAHFWLNGVMPHKPGVDLNYAPPRITLKKGWNRIMVKCAARWGYLGFKLHLGEANAAPLTGLKYSTEEPKE